MEFCIAMDAQSDKPLVSIIIPVKNAERYLPKCLESLNNITYPKDRYEVIISDSNSTDKTKEIAVKMGAKVVNASGNSVCAGRNSGFVVAKGDIIAFSDADCVMDREWLSNSIKYFKDSKVCCVGGPSLIPEGETAFGKACGFIFNHSLFTGGSSYGRNFKYATEVNGNPGCNSIHRRSALEKVMPVDECLVEAEDAFMNQRLRDLGYKFLFTPDTKLWHYRSSTPRRFWKQNFRYAIGRVLIGRRDKRLLKPLHYIAGFSIPIFFLSVLISWFAGSIFFISLLICYTIFLFSAFITGWFKNRSFIVGLNTPFAILILMTAWSLGFMQQLFRRGSDKK